MGWACSTKERQSLDNEDNLLVAIQHQKNNRTSPDRWRKEIEQQLGKTGIKPQKTRKWKQHVESSAPTTPAIWPARFCVLFWFWQNKKHFFALQWYFDLSKQKVLALVSPKPKQNRAGQLVIHHTRVVDWNRWNLVDKMLLRLWLGVWRAALHYVQLLYGAAQFTTSETVHSKSTSNDCHLCADWCRELVNYTMRVEAAAVKNKIFRVDCFQFIWRQLAFTTLLIKTARIQLKSSSIEWQVTPNVYLLFHLPRTTRAFRRSARHMTQSAAHLSICACVFSAMNLVVIYLSIVLSSLNIFVSIGPIADNNILWSLNVDALLVASDACRSHKELDSYGAVEVLLAVRGCFFWKIRAEIHSHILLPPW